MGKLILPLQLLIVFFIGWFSHELVNDRSEKKTYLYSQIQADLSGLDKRNELPKEFHNLAYFEFNFTPASAAEALGGKTELYPTSPKGKYFIGTEVFVKADEPNVLIFQYSIHEKKTRNKISELSREYKISQR